MVTTINSADSRALKDPMPIGGVYFLSQILIASALVIGPCPSPRPRS